MRRLLRWIRCGLGVALGLLIAYVLLSLGWIALHEQRDAMTSHPGRMVAVDGVQVHSQFFAGSGRTPVLLVHGTAAWSGTWFELIPALQRAGYPVIAIDLPPFGYSDKSTTLDFSREAQAERIGAVLDAYGAQRVIVVGHSFGGGPALEFALQQPQRVERLVLVDAALGLTSPPPDASSTTCRALAMPGVRNVLIRSTAANPLWSGTLLRSFVARKDAVTQARLFAYRDPARLEGASTALGAWAHHFACEAETGASMQPDRIRGLAAPTFLIWGADDTITPPAQAAHFRSLLPSAGLREIPGVGHIPHIEAPDAFARVLLDTVSHD